MKETLQFYCAECKGYFVVRLRTNIDGDYTIVCPKCEHEHFRKVKGGIITKDRHGGGRNPDRILGPPSAYSKEPILEEVTSRYDDSKIVRPGLWQRFFGRSQ